MSCRAIIKKLKDKINFYLYAVRVTSQQWIY